MAAHAASPDIAALLAQLADLLTASQPQPTAASMQRVLPQRVLFKVEEAAQQLGIGRTKVFELISTGELASVQIGKLRRVPSSAIADYAARLIAQQNNNDAA